MFDLFASFFEWLGAGGQSGLLALLAITAAWGWRALSLASALGGYAKAAIAVLVVLVLLPVMGIVPGYDVSAVVELVNGIGGFWDRWMGRPWYF